MIVTILVVRRCFVVGLSVLILIVVVVVVIVVVVDNVVDNVVEVGLSVVVNLALFFLS